MQIGRYLKYLKTWVFGVVVLVLALATLYVATTLNPLALNALATGLREAAQPLAALSVSLTLFPFISVSAVESTVSRARSLKIPVNEALVRDYVDGCFLVSLLSILELLLLVLYAFTFSSLIVFIAISVLASLVASVTILMLGLWQITRLLVKLSST